MEQAQQSGQFNAEELKLQVKMIDAMTEEEKKNPELLRFKEKNRLVAECGGSIQDVNRLVLLFFIYLFI